MTKNSNFAYEFLRIFIKGGVLPLWRIFVSVLVLLFILSLLFCYFEQPPLSVYSENVLSLTPNESSLVVNQAKQKAQDMDTLNFRLSTKYDTTMNVDIHDISSITDSINIRIYLEAINNNLLKVLGELQQQDEKGLSGKSFKERFYSAVVITFSAATIGGSDFYPHTLSGKIMLIVASCLGLVIFGMVGGIAFAAARAAYRRTHPDEFRSE